jgi:hypothetical protein
VAEKFAVTGWLDDEVEVSEGKAVRSSADGVCAGDVLAPSVCTNGVGADVDEDSEGEGSVAKWYGKGGSIGAASVGVCLLPRRRW